MSVAPSRELSPLQSLIERLEGASGPDREIDAAIAIWRYPALAAWPRSDRGGWLSPEWGLITPPPDYTDSVDAALALTERVLPGCRVMIERGFNDEGWAMVQASPIAPRGMTEGSTPAIAACLALLKAVQAQETLGQRNDGATKQGSTDV